MQIVKRYPHIFSCSINIAAGVFPAAMLSSIRSVPVNQNAWYTVFTEVFAVFPSILVSFQ